MNRPSRKEIKAAIEKLKEKPEGKQGSNDQTTGKLPPKHNSQRIRKKGI